MAGQMGEVTHAINVDAADEHFHARSDHPHWNESAWFGVVLPERRTTIYVYFFHRPNMNFPSGGMVAQSADFVTNKAMSIPADKPRVRQALGLLGASSA